jgi:hypothetical protein
MSYQTSKVTITTQSSVSSFDALKGVWPAGPDKPRSSHDSIRSRNPGFRRNADQHASPVYTNHLTQTLTVGDFRRTYLSPHCSALLTPTPTPTGRMMLLSRHLGRLRNGMLPAQAHPKADLPENRADFLELLHASGLRSTSTLPEHPCFETVWDWVESEIPATERGFFLEKGRGSALPSPKL